MENYINARTKELMKEFDIPFAQAHDAACKEASVKFGKKGNRQGTGKPAPEKVAYENRKGETIMCTPAQVARFEELKAQAPERKAKFEAMCADWNVKHEAYVPSAELIEAIKLDRSKVTRKLAKEKYGFVGTKDDLKALKAQVLAK